MSSDSGAPLPMTAIPVPHAHSTPSRQVDSGAPQVAAPPIGKAAGRTGGGLEAAPRRSGVPEVPGAQRGAPGRTGAQREGCTDAALDLVAVAWTDADIGRFVERRDWLVRWGWSSANAEALADRLVRRDRSGDTRVSCVECQHYRPGWCANHVAAELGTAEVGRDLAGLLQRCPGYAAMRDGTGEAAGRPATGPNGVRQYQREGSS